MNIKILWAKRYTTSERKEMLKSTVVQIGMNISGLEYSKVYDQNDRLFRTVRNEAALFLIPPGFKHSFVYGKNRENYVITCYIDELAYDKEKEVLLLDHGGEKLILPHYLPLTPIKLLRIKEIFSEIIRLSARLSVLPCRFAAEQKIKNILAELIVSQWEQETGSNSFVAEQLKQAIDKDTTFTKTMTRICHEIGYTPAYCRKCFKEDYGIKPGEYMAQKKLKKITEMLQKHTMTFKEIADEVGMKNVTHLYLFLKKHCNMTPLDIRRNRKK